MGLSGLVSCLFCWGEREKHGERFRYTPLGGESGVVGVIPPRVGLRAGVYQVGEHAVVRMRVRLARIALRLRGLRVFLPFPRDWLQCRQMIRTLSRVSVPPRE